MMMMNVGPLNNNCSALLRFRIFRFGEIYYLGIISGKNYDISCLP